QPPLNDNGRLVIVGKKKDGNWEKVTIDLGKEKKKPKVTEMKPNWDGLFFTAVSVGGELFFEVGGEDKYVIINEQGKVISKDYDSASTPFDVNGELYFTAEKDGKKFITNLKGERFFASNPYPCSIVEVNGKKYFEFLALDIPLPFILDESAYILDESGNRIGKEYDSVRTPANINGELFFGAIKEGKSFITNLKGDKSFEGYEDVKSPVYFNGQIYCYATKTIENKEGRGITKRFIVNEKGEEFELDSDYDGIYELAVVNNQLYFVVEIGEKQFFANLNGDRFGDDYDVFKYPRFVDGKLAFKTEVNSESKIVFIDVSGSEADVTEQAQEKLDLLNIVHDPEKDEVREHMRELEKEESKKERLETSSFVASMFNRILQEVPESFLEKMSARSDRAPSILSDRLISKMFPQAYYRANKMKERGGLFSFLRGGNEEPAQFSPEQFFSSSNISEMMGGGAEQINDRTPVMEFRKDVNELVVTGMYGSYDAKAARWTKSYIPLRSKPLGPVFENTATISNVRAGSDVMLPKPLDADLVPERVKGVTKANKEIQLKPETNSLGESMVRKVPKVEQILYTLKMGAGSEPMAKIDDQEYEKFKLGFTRSHGPDLTQKLANLPEEVDAFLTSKEFTKLSPAKKVMAIESYVRSLGFYDVNNQEVSGLKRGKNIEERMMISEMRLEELRASDPEKAAEFQGRRFAGVCADFAEITSAILRRAGFLAGVTNGLAVNGKTARVKNLHATSFVIWPDQFGQNRAIIVDGTPSSSDVRIGDMSLPTLEEREQKAEEAVKELIENAEEDMKEMMEIIKGGDADAILQLENGKLERVLNVILTHQVKSNHVEMLSEALNVYWYGGISKMDKP
ncbi:MAG: hypothetical protein ABH820_02375, partial [Patescibacteria group bacterium]